MRSPETCDPVQAQLGQRRSRVAVEFVPLEQDHRDVGLARPGRVRVKVCGMREPPARRLIDSQLSLCRGGSLPSPVAGEASPARAAYGADGAAPRMRADVGPVRNTWVCRGQGSQTGRVTMVAWITGGGILYFVLLVTLGILSIRKGHWVMFLVGLFIPVFWLIGALMPHRGR